MKIAVKRILMDNIIIISLTANLVDLHLVERIVVISCIVANIVDQTISQLHVSENEPAPRQ